MISLFISFLTILILAVLAAILSASETAVTASSRIRLHQLHKQGDKRAGAVLQLQSKMGQLIGTILLVNTWTLTCMTALATGIMTLIFGSVGAFYTALFMSAFITIYLEVMPKIYVYSQAEQTAMKLSKAIGFLRWALLPMTTVVDTIARFSLKMVGVKISSHSTLTSTVEELRGAIDLHIGEGPVAHERAMLRSILDLTQVEIAEIMVHRKTMLTINCTEKSSKIIEKVLNSPYTRIPLWKDNPDNIIGVLHVKALWKKFQSFSGNRDQFNILEAVTPPWFIPDTTTLFAQLQSFRERHEHLAFVVDEYGSLLGMVTLEDILEEIVGEIVDEHDVELAGVRLTAEGNYLVQGTVTLRDLNRQYDWNLPDSEATTLAGLILEETRHIPQVGQIFRLYGLEMKILRRHRNQITLIQLTPLPRLAAAGF